MSYVRCSGVRKECSTVWRSDKFREGFSGEEEPWALGIISCLFLLPSPELTHSPVRLSCDHWSDLSALVASLKNNVHSLVVCRVKLELSMTL